MKLLIFSYLLSKLLALVTNSNEDNSMKNQDTSGFLNPDHYDDVYDSNIAPRIKYGKKYRYSWRYSGSGGSP